MTSRHIATILAALRITQNQLDHYGPSIIPDDFDDFTTDPLTSKEIDALCESLNFETESPRFTIPEIAEYIAGWQMSRGAGIEEEHALFLTNAFNQLTDDQDGIQAVTERRRGIAPACHTPTGEGEQMFTDLLPDDFPPHDPNRWQTTDNFDDETRTNGQRAAEGEQSLTGSQASRRHEEDYSDLITNILHLAHSEEHDPARIIRTATTNFQAEAGPLTAD